MMRLLLVFLFPLSVGIAQFTEIPLPKTQGSQFRVTFTDPMHGWVPSTSGTLLRTSDGGVRWEVLPWQFAPTEVRELRIYPGGYGILWEYDENNYLDGRLYHTFDGGSTWSNVPMMDSTVVWSSGEGYKRSPLPIHATAPNHITYVGTHSWITPWGLGQDENFMATTSDGGLHWVYADYYVNFSPTSQYFWPVDTNLYAILDGGPGGDLLPRASQIRTSDDFGSTWTTRMMVDEQMNGIEFTDTNRGLAFFGPEQRGFFTTYDGGETWQRRDSYYNGKYGRFVNDTLLYFISSQGQLTRIRIYANGWHDGANLLLGHHAYSLSTCEGHVFVLTDKGLFHLAPDVVSVDVPGVPLPPLDADLSPQPARDILHIRFNATTSGTMEVAIFSILGNQMKEPARIEQGAGMIDIPTVGLPPGVYFLRIAGQGRYLTKKFTVSR